MRVYKLICSIVFTGCAAAPNVAEHVVTRDSAGVRITENRSSAAVDTWHLSASPIVELGADEPGGVLFRVRGAVRLNNGQYVVANGGYDELRWYDASGRFLRQAGRDGDMPGEFRSLSWVGRGQNGNVIAWDTRHRRVSVFAEDGQFLRSIPTQSRGVVYGNFSDGSLLLGQVRRGSEGFVRNPVELWRVIHWDDVADPIGSYPGDEQMVTRRPRNGGFRLTSRSTPFGRDGIFVARGQEVLVSDQQDYEIREYATDGKLLGILRLKRPDVLVTREDIAAYQQASLEGYSGSEAEERRQRLIEQRYPTLYPAHGKILSDQLENVWIQEYEKPWESTVDWLVFNRRNELVGRASFPAGLEIFEIGADFVLGMWPDEVGVEHVGVFELMKP